jgi:hypothetical protein
MNAVYGMTVGLAITMGGLTCSSQTTPVPFQQIAREMRLSAMRNPPDALVSGESSSSAESADPFASSAAMIRPAPVTIRRPIVAPLYLLNGLELGMAALDVETSHRCIVTHHCAEANPLMPSNLAGAMSVTFSLSAFSVFTSYRLKKQGSKMWWISPMVGTVAHTAGLATGLVHQ